MSDKGRVCRLFLQHVRLGFILSETTNRVKAIPEILAINLALG